MLKAMRTGEKGQAYITWLEKKLEDELEERQEHRADKTVEHQWGVLGQAMREAAIEAFPDSRRRGERYLKEREERTQLLRARARAREALAEAEEEQLGTLELQPTLATRRCRRLRLSQWKHRGQDLLHNYARPGRQERWPRRAGSGWQRQRTG